MGELPRCHVEFFRLIRQLQDLMEHEHVRSGANLATRIAGRRSSDRIDADLSLLQWLLYLLIALVDRWNGTVNFGLRFPPVPCGTEVPRCPQKSSARPPYGTRASLIWCPNRRRHTRGPDEQDEKCCGS